MERQVRARTVYTAKGANQGVRGPPVMQRFHAYFLVCMSPHTRQTRTVHGHGDLEAVAAAAVLEVHGPQGEAGGANAAAAQREAHLCVRVCTTVCGHARVRAYGMSVYTLLAHERNCI